ncbi:MAG TPA: hypothetical protein VGZ29_07570 [Terriglobia bacterium]|nr:hypothetical protein [Terriglobia bacterium]
MILITMTAVLEARNKKVDTTFDSAPETTFDAVYRYVQHNGRITLMDEKRYTITAVIFLRATKTTWRKDYDCTISVEPVEGGKSAVNIVGTYPRAQTSLIGMYKVHPAETVLQGIREEWDKGHQPGDAQKH